MMDGTAQPASHLCIAHLSEQADFPSGPAAWSSWKGDTPSLALLLEIAKSATGFTRQDRVWHLAKLFDLSREPRSYFSAAAHAKSLCYSAACLTTVQHGHIRIGRSKAEC